MKIAFHGAAGSVTGSCYQVTCGSTQFLVDCGMFQGPKTLRELNYADFTFDPKSISFMLVTHAHIDHTGMIPKLVKKGFTGPIYALEPTTDLLRYMLPDSAKIQESEVAQKNRRSERKGVEALQPIYTSEDAQATLKLLRGQKEHVAFNPSPGITVNFRNAGHILGSTFLEIELVEGSSRKKIVFSGDLGGKGHPIIKDPETFSECDVLLIESTYGDRLHKEDTAEDRLQKVGRVARETLKTGGNLLIPSFALERTQDLLYDLLILMDRGELPRTKVFVDSPLASETTKIFAKYPEYYDEEASALLKKQGNLFDHPAFNFTKSVDESIALNQARSTIILSSSGMCDAGRIKHHLKHQLWKKETTVLFVGFQAEGTLGRMLLEGAKTVRIHGEEVKVEARIESISGYSGHADQKELMDWLSSVKVVRDCVFVVHGEDSGRAELARLITEKKQFRTEIPKLHEEFDLLALPAKSMLTTLTEKIMPAPALVDGIDSFNVYAQLTLKLADFMRRTGSEDQRRKILEQAMKLVS